MLDHYPTPIFPVPLGTAPPGAPTKEDTEAHIKTFAPSTFLPKVMTPLPIVFKTLVAMMWKDANGGMSALACEHLCKSLLKAINGDLHTNPTAALLPTHYRRAMSELLSTAASLAVSQHLSPSYIMLKSDFNKLQSFYEWESLWKGSGPDYLVCSPQINSIYFLEVKGAWRWFPDKPPNFPKNKTQSLNGQVRDLISGNVVPVSRHVLSYGQIAPGRHLAVHWFNHERLEASRKDQHALTLIGALAQFLADLRAAGHEQAADAVEAGDSLAAREYLRDPPSYWPDRYIIDDPGRVRMVVEPASRMLFVRIARMLNGVPWRFRRNRIARRRSAAESIALRHRDLMQILNAEPAGRPGERLIFRLPTGISFWTRDGQHADEI